MKMSVSKAINSGLHGSKLFFNSFNEIALIWVE